MGKEGRFELVQLKAVTGEVWSLPMSIPYLGQPVPYSAAA